MGSRDHNAPTTFLLSGIGHSKQADPIVPSDSSEHRSSSSSAEPHFQVDAWATPIRKSDSDPPGAHGLENTATRLLAAILSRRGRRGACLFLARQ